MARLPLEKLVVKGRVTVIFLLDVAERLKEYPEQAELVADCEKLANILNTAVEAIAGVLSKEEPQEP